MPRTSTIAEFPGNEYVLSERRLDLFSPLRVVLACDILRPYNRVNAEGGMAVDIDLLQKAVDLPIFRLLTDADLLDSVLEFSAYDARTISTFQGGGFDPF